MWMTILRHSSRSSAWSEFRHPMRYFDAVNFDADAPAGSVFRIDPVRVPKVKNALRVIGSLIVGFLTMGFGPSPSSRQLMVRLVATGEALGEFKWSDGGILFQDLDLLTAGKFAEQWLPEADLALDKR